MLIMNLRAKNLYLKLFHLKWIAEIPEHYIFYMVIRAMADHTYTECSIALVSVTAQVQHNNIMILIMATKKKRNNNGI